MLVSGEEETGDVGGDPSLKPRSGSFPPDFKTFAESVPGETYEG